MIDIFGYEIHPLLIAFILLFIVGIFVVSRLITFVKRILEKDDGPVVAPRQVVGGTQPEESSKKRVKKQKKTKEPKKRKTKKEKKVKESSPKKTKTRRKRKKKSSVRKAKTLNEKTFIGRRSISDDSTGILKRGDRNMSGADIVFVETLKDVPLAKRGLSLKKKSSSFLFHNITEWQREFVYDIIKDGAEQARFFRLNDEMTMLNKAVYYLKESDYWDKDILMKISPLLPMAITRLLVKDIEISLAKGFVNHPILLLHTIDAIHGGPTDWKRADLGKWITDDFSILAEYNTLSGEEMRVISLTAGLIGSLNEDITVLSEKYEVLPRVKAYSYLDVGDATINLLDLMDLDMLDRETRDISMLVLLDYIDREILLKRRVGVLDQFELSYFRALACFIDKQGYDKIIDTIDG